MRLSWQALPSVRPSRAQLCHSPNLIHKDKDVKIVSCRVLICHPPLFKIWSQLAQAGLQLSLCSCGWALNSLPSCLCLPNAGVTGLTLPHLTTESLLMKPWHLFHLPAAKCHLHIPSSILVGGHSRPCVVDSTPGYLHQHQPVCLCLPFITGCLITCFSLPANLYALINQILNLN